MKRPEDHRRCPRWVRRGRVSGPVALSRHRSPDLHLRASPLSRSDFDHGSKAQTTGASRRCSLLVECGYRHLECHEGRNGRDASEGRFRVRQRYSHHDQSEHPSHPP